MSTVDERDALLASMDEGWRVAARTARDRGCFHRRDLQLAGLPLRLDLAGDELADVVLPALEIHPPATDDAPAVTIEAYDAAATGAPMPLDVRDDDPLDRVRIRTWPGTPGRPTARWSPRSEYGQVLAHVDGGPDRYTIVDTATGPWFEPGAPLRQLLAWALAPHGAVFLHAAAVGRPDGVVLLAGAGGAGKSSTALSALVAGLHFLGDDYCVLTPGSPPVVHTLYGVAKVARNQLTEVDPERVLHPYVIRPGTLTEDPDDHAAKAVVATSRWPDGRFLPHAPVRAIVVPDRQAAPGLHPLTGADALRHLAPTSLFQLRGEGATSFRAQADLVRQVPCFRLGLLPDRSANPPVIERLLHDLGAKGAP